MPTSSTSRWLAVCLTSVFAVACGDGPVVDANNRAPQVVIDSPANPSQFKPGSLYIELRASDADNWDNPEELTIELKYTEATGTPQTLNCESGATKPLASGVFSCTTGHLFEVGSYTLTVRALDTRGAFSAPATAAFTVVNDLPICSFNTPPSGSTQSYDEEVPTLTNLQCSDPDGEISRAQVCLESSLIGPLGCDTPTSDGAAQLQIKFNQPGTHIVTATVTDEDGGTGQDSFTAVVSPCEDEDGDGFYPCDSRDVEAPPDCDDDDPLAYPTNTEICDGRDSDCDGQIDNVRDLDGDGYLCDDCDNTVLSIHPGAPERCNGLDDDCDGSKDEDFDLDLDGYFSSCVVDGKAIDCNDGNPAINPGASETCDGSDTNCNNIIDDKDADSDGYVDSQCTSYTGSNGGDCDDTRPLYNPGIPEVCDGNDQDCDGRIDNDTPCYDDDGDGFCEANCTNGDPDGDCDDTFPYTYPGAVERFDWRDNDCDGSLEDPEIAIDYAWLFFDGASASSHTGQSLSGGDDVSGDGIDDLIIGAPGAGNGTGQATVIHGRDLWSVGEPLKLNQLFGAYTYTEGRSNAQAGSAVAIAGDMNGDGISEFAVGAPYADVSIPGFTLSQAGSAYILLGKASGWGNASLSSAVTRIDGVATGVNVGTSLAGGDLNGDGLSDLLVGGPQPTDGPAAGAGWAFVFPGRFSGYPSTGGPNSVFQYQGAAGQAMGRGVAVAGIHDGDSLNDFVIAGDADASQRGIVVRIPGDPGIVAGNRANIAEEQNGRWGGEGTGEEVGSYLSGGVDIDGNCYDDILIGRTYQNVTTTDGMAYVVLGRDGVDVIDAYADDSASIKFLPQADDNCPCSVTGIGDMNGDGLGDFAISAAQATVNGVEAAGKVYLFYGRDGGACETAGSGYVNPWPATVDVAEADGVFFGTVQHQRLGYTLAGVGDINNDGYDDLAIGAPFAATDNNGAEVTQAGRVFIQFGSPTP